MLKEQTAKRISATRIKVLRLYSHASGAYARLSPRSDGMWLDSLYVPSMYRRQGIATQLLLRVLADADRCGVKLFLTVSGDEDAMNDEQLTVWYARFGFVRRNALVQVRTPRGVTKNVENVL